MSQVAGRPAERDEPGCASSPTGPIRPAAPPEVADLVLHPVVLVALLVLVVNDHVAKERWPGLVAGKASDVAGLVVAPVVAAALVLGCARLLGRRPELVGVTTVCAIVVSVAFAASKSTVVGEAAYEHGLGVLQGLVGSVPALVAGDAAPSTGPVELVADRSDLIALPVAVLPVLLARRRATPPVSARAGRSSRGRTVPGWR